MSCAERRGRAMRDDPIARMIPKSMSSTPIGDGNRFSDKIMRKTAHDPEKWVPVFGQDHAQNIKV
jgi:hypothetical protein